jgi:hypothetical protein
MSLAKAQRPATDEIASRKGDNPMTVEANKLVMSRFVEFINTASETLATELISPDAIFYVPGRRSRCVVRLATCRSYK